MKNHINRRELLVGATALTASSALLPGPALAADAPLTYEPGLLDELLNSGKTVFLDFKASWCTTCAAQTRVMDKLKAENPAYVQHISFVDVDWDTFGRSQMVARMRIPRRSTLVVLKGDDELGRLVADTREAKIKELMDTALTAATGA